MLRLHKGLQLHEFGIHYPLNASSSCHIDLWVAFAIAFRVAKLELNFSPCPVLFWTCACDTKNYSIPLTLFDKTKGIEPYLVELDCVFSISTPPLNADNRFESLKELFLKYVDLTDQQFETILYLFAHLLSATFALQPQASEYKEHCSSHELELLGDIPLFWFEEY